MKIITSKLKRKEKKTFYVSVVGFMVLFLFSGCCFVTFYTRKAALKAQDALHNIKTLGGVSTENKML